MNCVVPIWDLIWLTSGGYKRRWPPTKELNSLMRVNSLVPSVLIPYLLLTKRLSSLHTYTVRRLYIFWNMDTFPIMPTTLSLRFFLHTFSSVLISTFICRNPWDSHIISHYQKIWLWLDREYRFETLLAYLDHLPVCQVERPRITARELYIASVSFWFKRFSG